MTARYPAPPTPPERTPALLISGASGGIGSVTCRRFLAEGFAVVGVDLAPAPFAHPDYSHLCADVTDPDALADMLSSSGVSRVDHVVTMAGLNLPEESVAQVASSLIDPETFRRSVALNLGGHFNVLHAALPLMQDAAADRSVTFVSSINAIRGFGLPAYSAAKAGLSGLMHALVPLLSPRNIRVNVVQPGTVRTPATDADWRHDPGHFERFQRGVPLGRLCAPGDVADVLLALTRLRHVTGQQLAVDGGQSTAAVN